MSHREFRKRQSSPKRPVPVSDGPTVQERDRRVQRTRRALREALIALLLERGWDSFSVQDVCDRADVGRSTFYTHFADKEDLLVGGFDDLRKMLRRQLAAVGDDPRQPLRFARGLIEHAFENQRLFRALVGRRSGQIVIRKFRELLIDLVREDLATVGGTGSAEAAVHFVAGGLLELLTWALESTRGAPSPAELEQRFAQMARPVVDEVLGLRG